MARRKRGHDLDWFISMPNNPIDSGTIVTIAI
jgi:hypothetical protein